MRAFAKQIGLGQSAVSQVLAGKKNLSLETAAKIASKLKLNEEESEYFRLLVQMESTKDQDLKKTFLNRAQLLNPKKSIGDLAVDQFALIADWYHIAIEYLTELKDFPFTSEEIAKRLGISKVEAEAAMERLLRLKLIEKDEKSKYRKATGYVVTESPIPNEALRRFHRQMLEKTIDSIETQSPQEKFIGTETFAISKDLLPKLFNEADQFLQKLAQLSEESKNKTDVYHVGLQIFNLIKGKKP